MRFDLSFGERWLLESAREHRYALPLPASPPRTVRETYNVACDHGLETDELWAAVFRLCRSGLLELTRPRPPRPRGERVRFDRLDRSEGPDPGRVVVPASAADVGRFAAWSEPVPDSTWRRGIDYGLTPAGGAAWEGFAAVDWTRYHTNWSFHRRGVRGGGPAGHHVLAARDETLNDVLRSGTYLRGRIDRRVRVRRGTFRPWPATYWKTLPVGSRLSFFVEPRDGSRTACHAAYGNAWPVRWWPEVYRNRTVSVPPPWFRGVCEGGGSP